MAARLGWRRLPLTLTLTLTLPLTLTLTLTLPLTLTLTLTLTFDDRRSERASTAAARTRRHSA